MDAYVNNHRTNIEPHGTSEKCHQNYCKNHSPFFFVSFFQSKMLKSIENLNLRHMRLVLQLTTDD